MKKIIIALIALLAAFSCAREEIDLQPTAPDQEKDNTPMSFNLSVNGMSGGAQTKVALKADWADGDVVYVFLMPSAPSISRSPLMALFGPIPILVGPSWRETFLPVGRPAADI